MKPLKKLALATGLYRPARALHRAINPKKRRRFDEGKVFYSQFVRPGDLCFDIGANIGEKTEILLSIGARVVAVEPQPDLVRELRARASRRNCEVVQAAISDTPGTAKLHLRDIDTLASLYENWPGTPTGNIEVAVTTLDLLSAKFGRPSFAKIDVEGYERKILKGCSFQIPVMSLEYRSDPDGVKAIGDCIKMLAVNGQLSINFTAGDDHALLLREWLSIEQFLEHFPACVLPHYYGDAIIKMLP
jgi:FkbM family methyltransferase